MGQRAAYDNGSWEQMIERIQNLLANEASASDVRTEFSPKFVAAAVGAMMVSRHKYGLAADAYPEKVNAIGVRENLTPEQFDGLGSFGKRLRWYFFGDPDPDGGYFIEPGNAEYLVDSMNFLMLEFMHPAHPEAHYKATDRDGSPGRVAHNTLYDGKAHQLSNTDIVHKDEEVKF
jgi:hypothetical protein